MEQGRERRERRRGRGDGRRQGVSPVLGALADLDLLRRSAGEADAVIHTAFGLDLARIDDLAREDSRAIEAFGEAFEGSGRPILVTGGVGVMPAGTVFTEDERPPLIPGFPRASEQTAFALAGRGLNVSVVRNPRSVHGQGERHGFVPMLAAIARARGVSAYVGDGENLWPSVHRLDAARAYRLALERGVGAQAYHAIAEEGVPFRLIAEAIGRQVGVPARSLTPAEAEAHFGAGMATWVAGNGPASSAKTQQVLGWKAREVGLIADVERAGYSERAAA